MPQPSLSLPTEQDAVTIVEAVLQRPVLHVHRFPTGLCHYVYDVVLDNRQQVVARLARADTQALLAGGVAWSHVLRPRGVPLPRLLHADVTATQLPFAFMLLEHLPGVDLGQTYPYLSRHQKQAIAAAVVRIQRQVHRLPQGTATAMPPHRTRCCPIGRGPRLSSRSCLTRSTASHTSVWLMCGTSIASTVSFRASGPILMQWIPWPF